MRFRNAEKEAKLQNETRGYYDNLDCFRGLYLIPIWDDNTVEVSVRLTGDR